jgi:two-component system NtrC family sensor kinase
MALKMSASNSSADPRSFDPAFYADLVEHAADPIVSIDPAGSVRIWNRAAERVFGYRREEVAGRPLDLLWPAGDAGQRWIAEALDAKAARCQEWRLVGAGDAPVEVLVTLSPVLRADGALAGMSGIFRDLAARRLREEERDALRLRLMQSEKMTVMSELIGGVAHELNNPLTGLIGYAQLLLDAPCDARVHRTLARIRDEATRCHRIVQNLLGFARDRHTDLRAVQVNEVLQATVELRAYAMRVDNIWVVKDLQADLPCVEADPHQLQQVFMNLLANAHQALVATGKGGVVTIATRRRGKEVEVKIADNGPGIAAENLGRIFEPFFTTKAAEGTGLGLALCKGIVEKHHGSIGVSSQPGVGTVFTLDLPAFGGAAAKAAIPVPSRSLLPEAVGVEQPRRVLVVDDEDTIREFLEEILLARGHQVATAANGMLALARIRAGHYDAVITDLRMPAMNGRELYEALVREYPALARRVIFATGDLVARQTTEFLHSTGNPFLEKPFSVRSLVEALRRIEPQNNTSSTGT